MKLSKLLLLLSVLAIGCESETGPNNTPATLIPLTEGNLWIYENSIYDTVGTLISRSYDTVTMGAAVTINGEVWYPRFFRPLHPSQDSTFYANRADGIWSRNVVSIGPSTNASSQLTFKYPTAVNDTFALRLSQPFPVDIEKAFAMTVATNEQVSVPAGTFSTIYYRRFLQALDSVTMEVKSNLVVVDQNVAPGIGLVKSTVESSYISGTGQHPDSLRVIRQAHETVLISYTLK